MSLRLEKQTSNITGDWALLSGDYLVACPGTFGTAQVQLQAGVMIDDGNVIACAAISDLTFTAEPEPAVFTFSGDGYVWRWVVSGVTTGTEVTPIAGQVTA